MLCVQTLVLGAYQTNCYVVSAPDCRHCLLIDPADQAQTVQAALKKLQLIPEAILLTHGHFDHVGAVAALAQHYGCRVFLHPAELTLPPVITNGPLFYTDTYTEGSKLCLAGLDISVLHTPGHTPGSVCLIIRDHLFTGDTLFSGSCGRTDLPGGDWGQILQSLKRLAGLSGNYDIFPGHGAASTLELQRRENPYL